jgi:hypothetical protein
MKIVSEHEALILFGQICANLSPQQFVELVGCSVEDATSLFCASVASTVCGSDGVHS